MDDSTSSVVTADTTATGAADILADMRGDWMAFLESQGAVFIDRPSGIIGRFSSVSQDLPRTDFVTSLANMALIQASGADAANFLHNQLTNDVEHLSLSEARLAGYCTPKGRLLATFLMWKSQESIFLNLPIPLRQSIQKRLQMFVMRSKVVLTDRSAEIVQIALAGPAATTRLGKWFATVPSTPYSKTENEFGVVLRLADAPLHQSADSATVPRYLWSAPLSVAKTAWPDLTSVLTPTGQGAWQVTDIMAGIPCVTSATQELFVPQMINFEAIGGVNFRKGCYPGQEIVARSQYLGKLKRRMQPARIAALAVVAGNEIFSESDPEQACGVVVNAAPLGSNETVCLVEIKLSMLDSPIHLGSIDGPRFYFFPLPYLLADAEQPDLR